MDLNNLVQSQVVYYNEIIEAHKKGLILDSFFNKILHSDSNPSQQNSDSDLDLTLQKLCGLGLESTKAGLYPSLI